MNVRFGLMTGAAIACAVLAGCKAPKAQVAADATPPPAQVKPAAVAAEEPKVAAKEDAAPQAAELPRCKCAPGTMHDSACGCGAADCKCKVRPPEPEFTVYRVKSGDTLSGICVRYGVRQSNVLALNKGMDANKLYAGAKIKLPGVITLKDEDVRNVKVTAAKSAAKPAAKASSYTGATKNYTVKSGDTLGKIAYANGISVKCLKDMNGLKKDIIRIGQKLKVPAEKVVAKKAAKAAAPVAKEKSAPAPAPAAPAAEPAPAPAAPAADAAAVESEPAPAAAPAAAPAVEAAPAATEEQPVVEEQPAPVSTLTHTVKDGEDIVSIAIHYNVAPGAIMDLNDLKNTDTLKPGQVLKLPATAKAQ